MRSIPYNCYQCKGLVSDVKSVVFYCDCSVTLCPGCARLQLAERKVTPYVNLVCCPNCNQTSCNLDPSTIMDQLVTAIKSEESLFLAAINRSKINSIGIDTLSLCRKLVEFSRVYQQGQQGPLLYDLTIEGRSEDELRTYILRAEICRHLKMEGRRTFDDLPLSPVEEVVHPQVHIMSVADAMKLEDDYLKSAYNYFDLGTYLVRNKENISSYKKLHDKFTEIGLLNDLNLDARASADYVRLCLARAEQYRLDNRPGGYGNVPLKDLPLGPLSAIKFKNDYTLERIVNGMNIENTCVVCRSEIKSGESVLFTCKCCLVQCKACVTMAIGMDRDTYRGEPVGIKCSICRQFCHNTVTNAQKAILHENELVISAFRRLYPEMKNPESFLFTDSRNSLTKVFSNTAKSFKKLDEIFDRMLFEAVDNDLYIVQTDENGQLLLAQSEQNLVRSGIARFENQYIEWKRLGCDEQYKNVYEDYLPLGPLTHLNLRRNRILEVYFELKRGGPGAQRELEQVQRQVHGREEGQGQSSTDFNQNQAFRAERKKLRLEIAAAEANDSRLHEVVRLDDLAIANDEKERLLAEAKKAQRAERKNQKRLAKEQALRDEKRAEELMEIENRKREVRDKIEREEEEQAEEDRIEEESRKAERAARKNLKRISRDRLQLDVEEAKFKALEKAEREYEKREEESRIEEESTREEELRMAQRAAIKDRKRRAKEQKQAQEAWALQSLEEERAEGARVKQERIEDEEGSRRMADEDSRRLQEKEKIRMAERVQVADVEQRDRSHHGRHLPETGDRYGKKASEVNTRPPEAVSAPIEKTKRIKKKAPLPLDDENPDRRSDSRVPHSSSMSASAPSVPPGASRILKRVRDTFDEPDDVSNLASASSTSATAMTESGKKIRRTLTEKQQSYANEREKENEMNVRSRAQRKDEMTDSKRERENILRIAALNAAAYQPLPSNENAPKKTKKRVSFGEGSSLASYKFIKTNTELKADMKIFEDFQRLEGLAQHNSAQSDQTPSYSVYPSSPTVASSPGKSQPTASFNASTALAGAASNHTSQQNHTTPTALLGPKGPQVPPSIRPPGDKFNSITTAPPIAPTHHRPASSSTGTLHQEAVRPAQHDTHITSMPPPTISMRSQHITPAPIPPPAIPQPTPTVTAQPYNTGRPPATMPVYVPSIEIASTFPPDRGAQPLPSTLPPRYQGAPTSSWDAHPAEGRLPAYLHAQHPAEAPHASYPAPPVNPPPPTPPPQPIQPAEPTVYADSYRDSAYQSNHLNSRHQGSKLAARSDMYQRIETEQTVTVSFDADARRGDSVTSEDILAWSISRSGQDMAAVAAIKQSPPPPTTVRASAPVPVPVPVPLPVPIPVPVPAPAPTLLAPARKITKPSFYIARFDVPKNLIASSSFEQIDKRRTSGRNPTLKVVVSVLDKVTFNTSSDSTDSFDLNMIKPSSNLKNTNGVICTHYKLTNIKILEYCSHDGTKLQDTRSMAYYNVGSDTIMYLDHIPEDNEIRAKGIAAKALAKWKSQGGRRHIEGSYGVAGAPVLVHVKAEGREGLSANRLGMANTGTTTSSTALPDLSQAPKSMSTAMPMAMAQSAQEPPQSYELPNGEVHERFEECAEYEDDSRF